MSEFLDVQLLGRHVGRLYRGTDLSHVRLEVDAAFDPAPVTLTEAFSVIPGRSPAQDAVSNFLGGCVPEGNQRQAMARQRGIDPQDLYALLSEFGGSLAGGVTVRSPRSSAAGDGWLETLTEATLADRLRQALRDTDQAVPADSRSTLPGFQPKVLVRRVASGWAQPHGSMHSTHILKPQLSRQPSRLLDEHYGHLLASHAGLSSFASDLLVADDVQFLAIERYDRRVAPDGTVELVHQEDLAQALGLDWRSPEAKFQNPYRLDDPSRPSAARIAALLASVPRGRDLVEAWVRRLMVSVVLGDNDAHAKNVSLIHDSGGARLAPAYDVVPHMFARGTIDEGFRMAMAINGSLDHRAVSLDAVVSEVASWPTMRPARAKDVVMNAFEACAAAVESVTPPEGVSPGVVEKLTWTVECLREGRAIGESPWQAEPPHKSRPIRRSAADRDLGTSRW